MNPVALSAGGGDPRIEEKEHEKQNGLVDQMSPSSGRILPHMRKMYDTDVTFEEYLYYAEQTREEELHQTKTSYEQSFLSIIFPSKSSGGVQKEHSPTPSTDGTAVVTEEEWTNASRALRTATRGAIFYLITTDILGPFALPYAVAGMGWG